MAYLRFGDLPIFAGVAGVAGTAGKKKPHGDVFEASLRLRDKKRAK
jgi:hypothetical protein